jgi:hypothetical protein
VKLPTKRYLQTGAYEDLPAKEEKWKMLACKYIGYTIYNDI